jgi:DNA-3-methyladenine glycosylase II
MKQIINSESIDWLCSNDSIFKDILDQYGVPPNWQREPGFVSLARIILEQQVSLESANACFFKLQEKLLLFSPEAILSLSAAELRECYVSRQKAAYLHALAHAVVEKTLDFEILHQLDEEEARQTLTQIKGIGNWTVDVYLLFCRQSPDVLPLGDIAVLRTLKELKGWNTKEEILVGSQVWQPHRSTAVFLLWHYYLNRRNRVIEFS